MADTTRAIGATEVVAMLTFLGIESQLVDFHRPTAEDGHHPELFGYILQYFLDGSDRPPLFLQREGGSLIIVGVEYNHTGVRLFVLDPSHTQRELELLGTSKESVQPFRLSLKLARAQQYQLVAIKGVYPNARERDVINIFFATIICEICFTEFIEFFANYFSFLFSLIECQNHEFIANPEQLNYF